MRSRRGRRVITFDNAGVGGVEWDDAEHHCADGARRDRLHRRAGGRPGRPARVLDRQLRRPGDRSRPARRSCAGWCSPPSAPQGAAGMHGWAPEVIGAVGRRPEPGRGYLSVFFTASEASRQAGQAGARTGVRRANGGSRRRRPPGRPVWRNTTRCAPGACRTTPCSAGRGDRQARVRRQRRQRPDDPAALLLPARRADPRRRVKLYPDAAHGFLFQHHAEFAADVGAFLVGA